MRVLVVEDEPDLVDALTVGLRREGYAVDAALDGASALDRISYTPYDAVLLDLLMPVMDGMTFLHKLRENPLHRGLPVIVLTAKDLSRDEQKELTEMASAVVHKGDEVEPQLRDLLGSYFTLVGADEPEE